MKSDNERLTLSPADAAAADALLHREAGGEPARRQRVEAWLKVLDNSPQPEPAGDLAARTLAAVQADRMRLPLHVAENARPGGMSMRSAARRPWRRRMAEIGAMAVAAALLVAVTLQGIAQARRSQARTLCQANLKLVTNGFGNYASMGAEGKLPMLALPSNRNWLRGDDEVGGVAAVNNAAHLLPLVTGQYLAIKSLFCAGAGVPDGPVSVERNALPPIGYSYCNMYGAEKPKWDGLRTTIILADKNPVFADIQRPQWGQSNSLNHDDKGNYVLRADGSVTWETSPDIGPNHDNIWTLGPSRDRKLPYSGREVPADLADVFLCP